MNPFINRDLINEIPCITDSDEYRLPEVKDMDRYTEIMDAPKDWAYDAASHLYPHTAEDLAQIMLLVIADDRPQQNRWQELETLCWQILSTFAQKEQDNV